MKISGKEPLSYKGLKARSPHSKSQDLSVDLDRLSVELDSLKQTRNNENKSVSQSKDNSKSDATTKIEAAIQIQKHSIETLLCGFNSSNPFDPLVIRDAISTNDTKKIRDALSIVETKKNPAVKDAIVRLLSLLEQGPD
ncbi:hypothetical protein DID75_04830 [Candidatus Marinamargulisbacteria bacterium SCGC AG-410-N11]|nr:hypothetical protein DID75_04830 [Candidatus Marinamargulisbacteria bacterium SCGC AG-410-N11]